jgi:putative peptidoglycan lipid II flippase
MNKNALIIAIAMLLSRILGIGREVLLARIAGVGYEKNALDLAFLIPDLLNHVVSTGFLSITFIPIFTGYLVQNKEEEGWRFFSLVLTTLALVMLVLIIPAWVFMPELLQLATAEDPSPRVFALAVDYGRIILPGQLFFLAGTFLVAVQHVRQRFVLPALTGLIYNVAIIAGGWLMQSQGLVGFAWGVPIGAFIGFFALQLWGAKQSGLRYKPQVGWNAEMRRFLWLTLPLVLGVGAIFALEFVNKSFGGRWGEQGVPALNYAYRMMYTLVAVFGFSVGVASYPGLARMTKEGRQADMEASVLQSLLRMSALLLPMVVGVSVGAHALIQIVLERGAFDAEATNLVAMLLRWYLPASVALSFQVVLVRGYYAREKMWRSTLLNSGVFALSLPAYGLLADIGVQSVPLVGAVAAYIQVALLFAFWQGWQNRIALKNFGMEMLRLLAPFALVLGASLVWQNKISGAALGLWQQVVLAILAGALQLGLQWMAGSEPTRAVVAKFKNKLVRA